MFQNPFDDLVPGRTSPPRISGPARQPAPQTPAQALRDANEAAASAYAPAQAQAQIVASQAAAQHSQTEAQQAQQQMAIRRGNIEAATNRLLDVGGMYQSQYQNEPMGPFSSIAEAVNLGPLTPTNQAFNAAGQGLTDAALPVVRVPGIGSQSDMEARMFADANRPRASNSDQANESILDNLQNRLNEQRIQLGLPPVDWRNPNAPQPGEQMDSHRQAVVNPNTQAQRQLGDGSSNLQEDPVLRGLAGRIGRMVSGGASDRQIIEYMSRAGVNPRETNLNQVLQYRRTPQFREWKRRNPRSPYPMGESFYTRAVPQTGARRVISSLANSPGGAYAVNAGDAATFGLLDNLTDNPTQARAGMDALSSQYPGSSLAGTISGGTLAAGGLELGAAGLGLRGIGAARAADGLYGAAYGAGSSDEGSRAGGALSGGLMGIGGGMAGRSATRGTGRLLTGARDVGTRYLADRGVPLTVGQIAGRGGVIGRAARGIEDKLESIPVLGDAIRARRAQGVRAFNREAFNQALEPIGANGVSEIGEEGVEQARGSVSGAYQQALNGVHIAPDASFVTEMHSAMEVGRRLPGNMSEEFRYTIAARVAPEMENGVLTGEGYQAIRQGLRQDRQAMLGQPRAHDFGKAVRRVENALERLMRRQAPNVVPALNRADGAYGRTKVVENAVGRGANAGGTFTPAQLGMAARQSGRRFGGNEATTSRPFFELQRHAQDILPSTTPNSGTVDRGIVAALPALASGAAYGAGYLSPENAAIFAALGLPFTQKGQAAFQKLLVSRPEVVRRAGEAVMRRQRIVGAIGAGSLPTMLPAPGQ